MSFREARDWAAEAPYRVGDIVSGKPTTFSRGGKPLIEFSGPDGVEYSFEVFRSTSEKFSEKSNEIWEDTVDNLYNEKFQDIKVRIFGVSKYSKNTYLTICFFSDNGIVKGSDLSAGEAFSALKGEHVFYGICNRRKLEKRKGSSIFGHASEAEDMVTRIECYDKFRRLMGGFLAPIDEIRRPDWEYPGNFDLYPVIRNEARLSGDIINGSEKYGFDELTAGSKLLVRAIGNNLETDKFPITYFFEPVVTIRECDKAINPATEDQIITGVKERDDEIKVRDYCKGDIVVGLPIVTTYKTEKFGEVGVGYVWRPENEFESTSIMENPLTRLKKVWIIGGADYLGSFIPEAELLSDRKVIIATI